MGQYIVGLVVLLVFGAAIVEGIKATFGIRITSSCSWVPRWGAPALVIVMYMVWASCSLTNSRLF